MSNVVRTVTRSTMIKQYLEYYKQQCHKPLSRFLMAAKYLSKMFLMAAKYLSKIVAIG